MRNVVAVLCVLAVVGCSHGQNVRVVVKEERQGFLHRLMTRQPQPVYMVAPPAGVAPAVTVPAPARVVEALPASLAAPVIGPPVAPAPKLKVLIEKN